MQRALLILLSLLWLPSAQAAPTFEGEGRATSGDTLIIGGQRLELLGIDAPDSRATCPAAQEAWPCGAEAKAALAERIAGRTLVCSVAHKVGHGYWQVRCLVDGSDLGAAQVEAGWAKAGGEAGADYQAAETEARRAGRGLWRNVPTTHPSAIEPTKTKP